jgi:rhamnosyltransferase
MTSPVDISIVMLVKNEAHHLCRSLPVILSQEIDLPYELIVIDSASSDGSPRVVAEYAQSHANVRLVPIAATDFHHARTRNFGAGLARGRLLVFLGGDAQPRDRQWLSRLVSPVVDGRAQGVVAAYSRQVPRQDADVNNICRMGYNYGSEPLLKNKANPKSAKERYFFSSVSCCIDLQAVTPPLFDETFPVNEDWTLARRLIGDGHQIAYSADSVVIHSHNYGYLDMLRRSFDNGVVGAKLGVLGADDPSVRREAVRYFAHGWSMLAPKGFQARLRFLLFFVVSGIGVQLGLRHRLLPRPLCSALSKYQTV